MERTFLQPVRRRRGRVNRVAHALAVAYCAAPWQSEERERPSGWPEQVSRELAWPGHRPRRHRLNRVPVKRITRQDRTRSHARTLREHMPD